MAQLRESQDEDQIQADREEARQRMQLHRAQMTDDQIQADREEARQRMQLNLARQSDAQKQASLGRVELWKLNAKSKVEYKDGLRS